MCVDGELRKNHSKKLGLVKYICILTLNFQNSLESEERAIVLPCELVESLSCQSSDCKQVVSQFKENLLCSEASLDNPDVETKALIRRFTREAKCLTDLTLSST